MFDLQLFRTLIPNPEILIAKYIVRNLHPRINGRSRSLIQKLAFRFSINALTPSLHSSLINNSPKVEYSVLYPSTSIL